MKPLRIGILTPTFLPKCSGAEIFHHNLAVRLAEAGHHPIVVVPNSRLRELRTCGWELPYEMAGFPGKIWNIMKHHTRLGLWLNRRTLDILQRRHRFDVWHAVVLYPAGVALADWQSRSRMPGLVRAVGDDVLGITGRAHNPQRMKILREKLPLARAVVALSQDMAEELAEAGVPRDNIHTIPNAVDYSRFEGPPPDRATVLSRLGFPPDSFVFLCVARNHPQKDFPTLFAAFRKLSDQTTIPAVRLIVAGRGVPDLRPAAEAAGISARVQLVELGAGRTENSVPTMPPPALVELYRSVDAYVMSSLMEGFSSAILEAMAAGLPLIVTDAPGIRSAVNHNREGLMVPCRAPLALAEAMRQVVNSSELRHRLSEGARTTARQYSWPTVTSAYLQLYRELIAGEGRA